MLSDLHCHSIYSDGDLSPTELVRRATEAGLGAAALTDHDTDAGTAEFCAAAKAAGLRVCTGIELSARDGGEVHILGYGVPLSDENEAYRHALEKFSGLRRRRVDGILKKLRDNGIELSLEDLDPVTKTPTRLHIARGLVEKGYALSVKEAYDRYLAPGSAGFVPYDFLAPEEAVEAIARFGGIPVLAHPGRIQKTDGERESLIRRLVNVGLRGIECRYPTHTSAETKAFLKLADRLGLIATGGSDFHRAVGVHSCKDFAGYPLDPQVSEELGL